MSDLPTMTTAQELERKVKETIQWMVDDRNRGLMSKEQFSAVSNALWKATVGLYPPGSNMTEVLTELMNLCDESDCFVRRSLCNDAGEILTFKWTVGYSYFTVVKRLMGQIVSSTKRQCDDSDAAFDAMNNMCVELVKREWVLI